MTVDFEVLFAAVYAIGLALVGGGFEWMAVRTERDAAAPARPFPGGEQAGPEQSDPSLAHLHAARFQRGLALVVCLCGFYVLIVVGVRHPVWPSLGLLSAAACVPGWSAWRIGRRFFGPSGSQGS